MEEITEIAKAYYANASDKQKQLAADLFKAMDTDGDGKISFDEYSQYIKKKFKSISSPEFFRKLDRDGDGLLDFDEFITVHYIYSTERVFNCDGCRVFLDGAYFTCVQCFNGSGNTFDLCCDCYRNKNLNQHQHSVFLDNYTLFQAKRNQNKSGAASEMLSLANFGVETTVNVLDLCSQM